MGNSPHTVPDRSGHPADIIIVIRTIVPGVPAPLGDCAPVLDVDSKTKQLGVTSNGSTIASGPEQRHWSWQYLSTEHVIHVRSDVQYLSEMGGPVCTVQHSSATRRDRVIPLITCQHTAHSTQHTAVDGPTANTRIHYHPFPHHPHCSHIERLPLIACLTGAKSVLSLFFPHRTCRLAFNSISRIKSQVFDPSVWPTPSVRL